LVRDPHLEAKARRVISRNRLDAMQSTLPDARRALRARFAALFFPSHPQPSDKLVLERLEPSQRQRLALVDRDNRQSITAALVAWSTYFEDPGSLQEECGRLLDAYDMVRIASSNGDDGLV
jgi:hypothetical protein